MRGDGLASNKGNEGIVGDVITMDSQDFKARLSAELAHIRRLGNSQNLAFVASNLSAYEAVLITVLSGEKGMPVYSAIENVQTPFSGPAGIVKRIKTMRELGLLDTKPGEKKSQVCLMPSETLMRELKQMFSPNNNDHFRKCDQSNRAAQFDLKASIINGVVK